VRTLRDRNRSPLATPRANTEQAFARHGVFARTRSVTYV